AYQKVYLKGFPRVSLRAFPKVSLRAFLRGSPRVSLRGSLRGSPKEIMLWPQNGSQMAEAQQRLLCSWDSRRQKFVKC
ncbi:MAG: hypothetical protein LUF00_13710, partial [Lachnospiraceae bacterium]|nr:hypothetical protein [Lachnospiraceae bacterium]